jgi:hypothetical protein
MSAEGLDIVKYMKAIISVGEGLRCRPLSITCDDYNTVPCGGISNSFKGYSTTFTVL